MGVPTAGLFNTAYRGMAAAQTAMSVINNNISNAATPGYSRQRVELATTYPLGLPINGKIGYLGQGPEITGITRAHDNYLDKQIQIQSSRYKLHDTRANLLSQLEGIMGEPQGAGISQAMNDFFDKAQALSVGPNVSANRTAFMQSANNLMNMFQDVGDQLNDLRNNITGTVGAPTSFANSLMGITATDINTKLSNIADLNREINSLTVNGSQPNDLLDKRDVLMKELAEKINVDVTYADNNQISIRLGSNVLVNGSQLVNTLNVVANTNVATQYSQPALVQLVNGGTDVTSTITGGELGAYITMGGAGSATLTTPRSLLVELDDLFNEIATQVNTLQGAGIQLDGTGTTAGTDDRIYNFTATPDLALFGWSINNNIMNDTTLIAAGQGGGVGDGRQALEIAQLKNQTFAGIANQSFESYFNNTISDMGVSSQGEQRFAENFASIIEQYTQRQQSIQGVNVEEEMVNLLKFQRGFEASSRALRAMDETIQGILSLL